MRRDATGLTLIEATFALTVLSILLTVGLPAATDTLDRMRIQTTLYRLGADFALARATAITHRTQVVVCPADPGDPAGRCRPDRRWDGGWLVFLDPDGNRQPDRPQDLIRHTRPSTAASGRTRIHATRTSTRFQRDGRSAGTNLSVHLCRDETLEGSVVLNNLGRIRSGRPRKATGCPA